MFKVTITEDDLKTAVKKDPKCCLIAQAIKRENPDAGHVWVGSSVEVGRNTYSHSVMSERVLRAFDSSKPLPVLPLTLEFPE